MESRGGSASVAGTAIASVSASGRAVRLMIGSGRQSFAAWRNEDYCWTESKNLRRRARVLACPRGPPVHLRRVDNLQRLGRGFCCSPAVRPPGIFFIFSNTCILCIVLERRVCQCIPGTPCTSAPACDAWHLFLSTTPARQDGAPPSPSPNMDPASNHPPEAAGVWIRSPAAAGPRIRPPPSGYAVTGAYEHVGPARAAAGVWI